MSFTSEVKEEVTKLDLDNADKISELSGIMQNNYNEIKVQTESNSVARRVYSLIKDLFNVSAKVTLRRGYNYNKKILYIVRF